jgi:ABC-type dipeptide/oligopeptide/nickel transport system permease subunit
LGTDRLGRDQLGRLIVGSRVSIEAAAAAALTACAVGGAVGSVGRSVGWARVGVTVLARVLFFLPRKLLSTRGWGRWIVAAGCLAQLIPATWLALAVVVLIGPGFGVNAAVVGLIFAVPSAYVLAHQESLPASRVWGPLFCSLLCWVMLVLLVLDACAVGIPPPTPSWGGLIDLGAGSWWLGSCVPIAVVLGLLSLADALADPASADRSDGS